jgi:putative ATPase
LIEKDKLPFGMIFFGPPGCSKTTLARVISTITKSEFVPMSATSHGINDIRKAAKGALDKLEKEDKSTVIMMDEIHRLNRNVQDVLLPLVEEGFITLIGITTSNPYFAINGALLSRSELFEFRPFGEKELVEMISRAVKHYHDNGISINFQRGALNKLVKRSSGDARKLYNIIEAAVSVCQDGNSCEVTMDVIDSIAPRNHMIFDQSGEDHYDMASCVQGAIQASDADAAVYWLARWIESGEDPLYICRRLMVSAAEDAAGNPLALTAAVAAFHAVERIGLPEGAIPMSYAAIMIAESERNKRAAMAIWEALEDVRKGKQILVPQQLKDCHYKSASKLGRGSYKDGANQEEYPHFHIKKRYVK